MTTTERAIKELEDKHRLALQGSIQDTRPWHRIALGAILLIAAFLDFYRLWQINFPNSYYASAIKSMLQSWHNFFFVSFDPGGFVTVDKPPLGFWIQVLSAKIFGFSPFSVLLPEALATMLSVALLYYLVRRVFGPVAGLIAALVLALMPISVVTSHNNTIDSILVLTVLLGAWAASYAAETGKLRWLLLSAFIVGLGFNVKMLEAYLVVPAFGLLYLLGAPRRWPTRIGHLALASIVLLVISFSWAVAVDLTPASQRPYVGSSSDNSEITLALGYNGIERLVGLFHFDGGRGSARPATNLQQPAGQPSARGSKPAGQGGNAAAGGPFAGETGAPGVFRLFNQQLGGQISWLLPLALLSMLVIGWQTRWRNPLNRKHQALVLWGMWLLTMAIFFSVAGFFHTYYLVMLAPSIAALVGAGIVTMWQDYKRPGWRGWTLPLALVGTAAVQAYILSSYPQWSRWLTPLVVGVCLIAAVILVVGRLTRFNIKLRVPKVLIPAVTAGMLALLIAPAAWAAVSVVGGSNSPLPSAGPRPNNPFGITMGRTGNRNAASNNRNAAPTFEEAMHADPTLVRYLEANQGNTKFLVATTNANTAAPIILDTGKPVMAIGGFIGSDNILTLQQLIDRVNNGTVRFFLLESFRLNASILDYLPSGIEIPQNIREEIIKGDFNFEGFGGQNGAITDWVSKHCTTVPSSQWKSASSNSARGFGGFGGQEQLYDCAKHS